MYIAYFTFFATLRCL